MDDKRKTLRALTGETAKDFQSNFDQLEGFKKFSELHDNINRFGLALMESNGYKQFLTLNDSATQVANQFKASRGVREIVDGLGAVAQSLDQSEAIGNLKNLLNHDLAQFTDSFAPYKDMLETFRENTEFAKMGIVDPFKPKNLIDSTLLEGALLSPSRKTAIETAVNTEKMAKAIQGLFEASLKQLELIQDQNLQMEKRHKELMDANSKSTFWTIAVPICLFAFSIIVTRFVQPPTLINTEPVAQVMEKEMVNLNGQIEKLQKQLELMNRHSRPKRGATGNHLPNRQQN